MSDRTYTPMIGFAYKDSADTIVGSRSEGKRQSKGRRLFVHRNIIKNSKPVKTARNSEAIMYLLIGLHCKKDITGPHLPLVDAFR